MGKDKKGKGVRGKEISAPFGIQQHLHVDHNYVWSESKSDDFMLYDKLGSGSFGSVYLAIHKATHSQIAIKIITLDERIEDTLGSKNHDLLAVLQEDVKKELVTLRVLNHESVIKYYGCRLDRDDELGVESLWIMMEYCMLGSVHDMMMSKELTFTEAQVAYIMKWTLEGIHYLHMKGFSHKDIKGSNLLMDGECRVKLADFGVTEPVNRTLSTEKKQVLIGTMLYMAPEIYERNVLSKYSMLVDIWALGITAIELIDGNPPHAGVRDHLVAKTIIQQDPPTCEAPQDQSKEFNDFVKQCLVKNPAERPDAARLLKHPFLKKGSGDPKELFKNFLVDRGKKQRKSVRDTMQSLFSSRSSFFPKSECKAQDMQTFVEVDPTMNTCIVSPETVAGGFETAIVRPLKEEMEREDGHLDESFKLEVEESLEIEPYQPSFTPLYSKLVILVQFLVIAWFIIELYVLEEPLLLPLRPVSELACPEVKCDACPSIVEMAMDRVNHIFTK